MTERSPRADHRTAREHLRGIIRAATNAVEGLDVWETTGFQPETAEDVHLYLADIHRHAARAATDLKGQARFLTELDRAPTTEESP